MTTTTTAAATTPAAAAAATARCHRCGAAFVKATAKFCSKCGTKKLSSATTAVDDVVTMCTSPPPPSHERDTLAPAPSSSSSVAHTTHDDKTTSCAVRNDDSNDATAATSATSSSPSPSGTTASDDVAAAAAARTLHATPEEEAQYTAWATLRPDDLTPEMLQTANAAELRAWRRGGLIGRGTYGSVHLGLLPDGSFYAVKCVELSAGTATASGSGGSNNNNAGSHGVVAAAGLQVHELVTLSREIRLMQRLRHRNVCQLKGVYYDARNASVCLFMEYVSGGSLASLVRRLRPLPPSVVRAWTRQLLCGLLYLHAQHILHRDIKGDNVLIDLAATPASRAQVKLADFGAARRLGDAATRSRTVIGTPYWMAPEVVTSGATAAAASMCSHKDDNDSKSSNGSSCGEGGYSYKADVWSVGCTVAEMLTGKPPWSCCTNAAAAICMIANSTGLPNELPLSEATPGCADFMRQCLIRNPDERPTVEQLLQHPWIVGDVE